jgi:sugar fermentation stimulation protein A
MYFPAPLLRGRLIQRYKRFLADVQLTDGNIITATCPNTGSLLGLASPGSTVWLSESATPTRKYRHTWELVEADLGRGAVLVGINTGHPNNLVAEAIAAGQVHRLRRYADLKREQKYGRNSRIDILLHDPKRGYCYVEVKNVHLSRRHGLAEFPDSITERGTKHLSEMTDMVNAGCRAVMVFLVQRGDVNRLSLARDIDTRYAQAFDKARAAGVEAMALRCCVSQQAIEIEKTIPIVG